MQTYKISEGGTYKVRAYSEGNLAYKDSNEVELPVETVTITTCEYGINAGTIVLKINVKVDHAIIGVDYGVSLSKGSDSLPTINGRRILTWTANAQTHTFNQSYGVTYDGSQLTVPGARGQIGASLDLTIYSTTDGNVDSIKVLKTTTITPLSLNVVVTPEDYVLKAKFSWQPQANLNDIFEHFGLSSSASGDVIEVASLKSSPAELSIPAAGTYYVRITPHTGLKNAQIINVTSTPAVGKTITVKDLEAPVLSYDKTTGNLQWEDVEGAVRYEVYKDDAKIADVPVAKAARVVDKPLAVMMKAPVRDANGKIVGYLDKNGNFETS